MKVNEHKIFGLIIMLLSSKKVHIRVAYRSKQGMIGDITIARGRLLSSYWLCSLKNRHQNSNSRGCPRSSGRGKP